VLSPQVGHRAIFAPQGTKRPGSAVPSASDHFVFCSSEGNADDMLTSIPAESFRARATDKKRTDAALEAFVFPDE